MNTEHTNQPVQAEPVNQQLLALVKSFGHKTGCAKNAFAELCTCGVDEAIAAAEQAQQAAPVGEVYGEERAYSDYIPLVEWHVSTRELPKGTKLYTQPPAVAVAVSVCNWNQEDDGGSWVSDCGQYFTLDDGDPSENGMKFCHSCGKRLAEHPWQDEGEEADESAMLAAAQKGGEA